MGGCHRLTCSARGKTSSVISFGRTGGSMSRQRRTAYLSHLKDASAHPTPAHFDSFARSVILRKRLFKKGQHPLGALRSPSCQRSLIISAIFLISRFLHKLLDY